jgi:hypothetical protein
MSVTGRILWVGFGYHHSFHVRVQAYEVLGLCNLINTLNLEFGLCSGLQF